jgi:hypothetical protein
MGHEGQKIPKQHLIASELARILRIGLLRRTCVRRWRKHCLGWCLLDTKKEVFHLGSVNWRQDLGLS